MKAKLLSALTVVPLMAAGAFIGAGSANAAVLTGPGEISFGGVIKVSPVFDDLDADGFADDLAGSNFDFVLPVGGGTGDIEVGVLTGIDGFSGFDGSLSPDGNISDISIKELPVLSTTPGLPINNFLVLDGGADPDTSYRLEAIPLTPKFVFAGGSTFVEIKTTGTWFSGNGETLDGAISFSATYVGIPDKATFFSRLGSDTLPPVTFAAQGEAFEVVPEPTTALGAFLALGLGGLSFRKKKQQIG